MTIRAIRAATSLEADDPELMEAAVVEVLRETLDRNGLSHHDLIFAFFTATADLVSSFPAAGARAFGLGDVPLLCAQEIDVVGAPPRIVRIMLLAHSAVDRSDIRHVYLRGTQMLRQDLAQ